MPVASKTTRGVMDSHIGNATERHVTLEPQVNSFSSFEGLVEFRTVRKLEDALATWNSLSKNPTLPETVPGIRIRKLPPKEKKRLTNKQQWILSGAVAYAVFCGGVFIESVKFLKEGYALQGAYEEIRQAPFAYQLVWAAAWPGRALANYFYSSEKD